MGVRYSEEGQKPGYFITCVAKSMIRPEVVIRKQRYLGRVSERDAQLEYRQLYGEVRRALLMRERGEVSWGHILESWCHDVVMASPRGTFSKQDTYQALRLHTKNWFNVPVDKITTLSFQMVINEMENVGLSRGRIRAVKCAVSVVFEWAILNKLIPPTTLCPTKGARLPKAVKKEKPVLNSKEIEYLLAKALEDKHQYFPVWAVAFETGCRAGELWALKWNDVDFDQNIITISKSHNFRSGIVKPPKNNKTRVVPMSREFKVFLSYLKETTGSSGYILPRISSLKNGKAAMILRHFCREIGVPEIPFHGTRACFATLCLNRGVPLTKLMAVGGWSRLSSVQHYTRLVGTEIRGITDDFNILPIIS
ncbi:tyrosine-type recombinase/integrase [Bdellovibrio sp. BCCA]|uniref:tyrosine-type recombinase/integrase n=1 Tax=Bdellovibrio sp. BCCA TaxID=3136281 RepID=UPI0030F14841